VNAPWIRPDWPAPPTVRACVTTRHGGVSDGPFASLNLADHVGDDPAAVAMNRSLLRAALDLPAEPVWLEQVHGNRVVDLDRDLLPRPRGDAAVSRRPGAVCAVLTADCLPVLLCDRAGTVVGAAHAGWRGLAAGVVEALAAAMGRPGTELIAWLGPAIGPAAFVVGPEVHACFTQRDPGAAACFRRHGEGRWRADLYALARRRLEALGVEVHGGGFCTVSDDRFFSYRRDGVTGRMAALIWREAS